MTQTSQEKNRCGSGYHLIAKCTKPQKDNDKRQNQVRFNEEVNRVRNSREKPSNQKIYEYMARMSNNDKCPSGDFGDSSQLTNWILNYGAPCHMTPDISDFIPGSL